MRPWNNNFEQREAIRLERTEKKLKHEREYQIEYKRNKKRRIEREERRKRGEGTDEEEDDEEDENDGVRSKQEARTKK